jgi:hypothetical protein
VALDLICDSGVLQDSIDTMMPWSALAAFQIAFTAFGAIFACVAALPAIVVVLPPLFMIFLKIQKLYREFCLLSPSTYPMVSLPLSVRAHVHTLSIARRHSILMSVVVGAVATSREVKRIEGVSKSPVSVGSSLVFEIENRKVVHLSRFDTASREN